METTTCPECGATVGDEQFCPSCGHWLDPLTDFESFRLPDAPPAEDDAGTEEPPPIPEPEPVAEVSCPSCGASNPAYNRHCEQCGARIAQHPLPVAPQPLVRSSPGVRALAVLAAVVAVVVLAALAVGALRDGDEPPVGSNGPTTTTTAPDDRPAARPITVAEVIASSELPPNWLAANLVDSDTENSWNDAGLRGVGAQLTFIFAEPVELTSIVIQNVSDEERFHRNYRMRGIEITTDESDQVIVRELEDTRQPQTIPIATFQTRQLTITVTSTYNAEPFDGEVAFEELALQEVKFFGRPAG